MIYAIADVPHEDYDNYDMLNKLFHALSPHGWKNSSCKYQSCPSLIKEELHGNTCNIFVDYMNPKLRDYQDLPECAVLLYTCRDADGRPTFHEEFDNVDKLIVFMTEELDNG